MYEIHPPRDEGRSLISKDLPIPLCPDIPCSSKDHLCEERITKIPLSRKSHLICSLVWLNNPRNPKVVSNPLTEVASKEEMRPVFMRSTEAKNTCVILYDPLSALHHIPSIQTVHQKKPSKHFKFERTSTLPNPSQNGINH